MLSVSQELTPGLWFLERFERDSTSSGSSLEPVLKLEPVRRGGEARMSDSLVGTSIEVSGLLWMNAGTAGVVVRG